MATPTKPPQPRHTITAHGVAVGDRVWEFPRLREVTAVETRTSRGLRGDDITLVRISTGNFTREFDPQAQLEVW